MQIDELRSELTKLSDEIGPFEGDVQTLHRQERRRRVLTSTLAALLIVIVVVVGASTVAVVRRRGHGSAVTATGPKEASSAEISHVDVIVIPASPAVEKVLGSSPLVAHYTPVPRAVRLGAPLTSSGAAFCALETNDGFAVQASSPGSDIAQVLSRDLAGRATVYDVSDTLAHGDIELFLRVGASSRQAESVRAALKSDPDISSFRYLTHADAYEIFKQEFADQPALVQSTKPSDLPESFRIILQPGKSLATTAQRYRHLNGVDSFFLTPRATFRTSLFSPTSQPNLRLSSCRKP
ncbi:MAG TPA: permease-like cell division protein FtsX [Acidimicrobiia bacterium]|nr:permease-like cell division protein FtsX [Acidimicrobiia bacterium]